MYNHTMVIYIQYKFDEIPSICYEVMAEEEKSLKLRQLVYDWWHTGETSHA